MKGADLMAYNGLETAKPTKPIQRGDLFIFPKTTADQIITDEDTDERLPDTLGKKMDKSGGNFTSPSVGLSNGAMQLVGTDQYAAIDIYYTDTDNIEKFRRLMFQNNGNLVEEFWKADTSVCYGTNVFAKGKKLLWQNASPTTGMGAQTINLDLSEYDMVMVECYLTASITLRINAFAEITDGTKNGFLASGVYGTNNKIYGLYRPMYVTKTGIELGNSYATTPSSDENVSIAAIPYKIYGIKGVQ